MSFIQVRCMKRVLKQEQPVPVQMAIVHFNSFTRNNLDIEEII